MGGIPLNLYEEEEREEREFWEQMGNDEGYISSKCPNCGRIRVSIGVVEKTFAKSVNGASKIKDTS